MSRRNKQLIMAMREHIIDMQCELDEYRRKDRQYRSLLHVVDVMARAEMLIDILDRMNENTKTTHQAN